MLKKLGTLLFIIASAIASANDDAHPGNKTVIHIGVEAMNYCPILCFEQNATTGLLIELLEIIKEKSGINYQLTPYAIPRLRKEFNSGNIDVRFPDNPDWSRGAPDEFSAAIIPYRDAFFSLKTGADIHNMSAIQSAAIPAGYYIPKAIRRDVKVIEASSIEAMFTLLKNERVDAIYLHHLVAQNIAKQNGLNIVERTDYPADKSHFHFRSHSSAEFLKQLNTLVNESPEVLQNLLRKYELN